MLFKVGNTTYKIGSKLFPVAMKNHLHLFMEDNTAPLADNAKELLVALDRHSFAVGRCYGNTDAVTRLGRELGLPVTFHAGWLFPRRQLPIHHAWAVLGNSILDVSLVRESIETLTQIDEEDLYWREKVAPILATQEKQPTSQSRVLGQVPHDFIYVGCPDDAEHARETYRRMMAQFPKHPSYRHGHNALGESRLQETMRRMTQNV